MDFLHSLTQRCVELLEATAVGILAVDQYGTLNLLAASSEQVRLLELLQLQNEHGPCLDAFHTGAPAVSADLDTETRWPRFTEAAIAQGFHSVQAVPMRLRHQVIGAMNLFMTKPGGLTEESVAVAQSFADVATISIIQVRALRESELLAEQLQSALNSRIVIEQAKGMLAVQRGTNPSGAFELMREYSRQTRTPLSTVAQLVIQRSSEVAALTARR
ncbi:ANTAR domain-containing protein [Pseudonocardiaceae bacterium YIM PH 21723]|nr:ANTAR domain-containing protein [Pseudonocardiaceae bacterium YIM PH 21723]